MTITTVSFYRRYHGYTGGHQKVRDYLEHMLALDNMSATLWLENRARIQTKLFDGIDGVTYQERYCPEQADIVFLAGLDWQGYLPHFNESQPRLNLIQHVRHGDAGHPLFAFLQHRAVRLCVSEAVRQAILPYANGPCITVKMGHRIPNLTCKKQHQLYILATKAPQLGQQVAEAATRQGLKVLLHCQPVERQEVHLAMARSLVTLTLPNKTEGFFLPGIEAMALSDWAIVPDCIASREYTLNGANISSCERDPEACLEAVLKALQTRRGVLGAIRRWQGAKLAHGYSIGAERKALHQIMQKLPMLWAEIS
ncbi:glycosyltransferase [Bowmanella denitrificans]|uniref:glycosyltransferase n=1 Tax=Bowmanella denitrificans TaxID=366582 RepID=UPI000C9BD1F4|nr:glycosyltransferase [Bowmanella denitrificans]